jgi:hypothetical protein
VKTPVERRLLGALLMIGLALLLSVGLYVLPVALLLFVVAAVWAKRLGKARSFWTATTAGLVSVLIAVVLRGHH